MTKLNLETNPRNPLDVNIELASGAVLMVTAALPAEGWLFRIRTSRELALLAVPRYGGVDIVLQSPMGRGLSAPAELDVDEIIRLFRKRGAPALSGRCVEAVKMLRDAVRHRRMGGVAPA
jgi:hypothetical protein